MERREKVGGRGETETEAGKGKEDSTEYKT